MHLRVAPVAILKHKINAKQTGRLEANACGLINIKRLQTSFVMSLQTHRHRNTKGSNVTQSKIATDFSNKKQNRIKNGGRTRPFHSMQSMQSKYGQHGNTESSQGQVSRHREGQSAPIGQMDTDSSCQYTQHPLHQTSREKSNGERSRWKYIKHHPPVHLIPSRPLNPFSLAFSNPSSHTHKHRGYKVSTL